MSIVEVKTEYQIVCLAEMARIIWHEHYEQMLGTDQVNYMLEKFQSAEAIHNQLNHQHYHYYLLTKGDASLGFMGIQQTDERLYLSKVYLLREERGKGYAKKLINFAENFAKENSLKSVYLTVNRNNLVSIEVYKKCGFQIIREQVADIGCGYVMDDYIMEKELRDRS